MSATEKSIKNSIIKNGFPEKKVNLPFKPVFEACKKNNEKLSDVLDQLKMEGIMSQIGNEKILFYAPGAENKSDSKTKDTQQNMYQAAMDQLKNMDPEQVEEIKKKVMSMSPEEREALMKQAQDFLGKKK